MENDLLILGAQEVNLLLEGRELELIEVVRSAYEIHGMKESSLPQSLFLRFPFNEKDRIIALPAFIGGKFNVAGIKWISSFPGNLEIGLDRASAIVIINSPQTGRPEAIIEGSILSAKRTAASAALAAQCLYISKAPEYVGFIGCGLINFEIARFLLAVWPNIRGFTIYDVNLDRLNYFEDRCLNTFAKIKLKKVETINAVLSQTSLISIATTSTQPHIFDLSNCLPNSLILHISLRDIAPQLILAYDNVVDDIDHICRAQTSVHLAEQMVGNRNFIRCTLADILKETEAARNNKMEITIFSPFGLGILDIAMGKFLRDSAIRQNQGALVKSFLPDSWIRIEATKKK